ncbi:thiamine pyrophosphate-binding protein [Scleromatobacter humisilvae]|uniref:Thiamine pyrophosphate-binding protein n=1 Tax=Scleromatobacter humisilvae TaxID=2897159 RepID=A0A9X2BZ69_9BURK|nr:thiamine pyrophosphate-binding protein [Scleromatobacter humisilvae]MCK9685006.1 thiamine pyrophosphate-binding protein [Scleromatobacter humisilvae]
MKSLHTTAISTASATPRAPSTSFVVLKNQTVSQVLLKYLALEGVDTLFGVPGGAVMHLLDELMTQRDALHYVVCRQETGAAYIADGYARVSGKLGVVVVTSGPGATNALTGTMNAQNAGVSLLTITGEVGEQYFGMGYLQEGVDASLNIDAVYGNASGYSAVITNPSNFQALFAQALREALGVPHRAAHISLPDDQAGMPIASLDFPLKPQNYRATPSCTDAAGARRAFEQLAGVARPLIFLGSGAAEALRGPRLAAFAAMVDRLAIPVMTTPDAKGIFPESHPMSLRNFGTAFCEWTKYYMVPRLLDPAAREGFDSLLVLGTTLGGLATNKWDPILLPQGSLVQVDIDASVIGRVFPLDFGVVAEIGSVIDELVALADATQPDARVQERRAFIQRIKAGKSPWIAPEMREARQAPIPPQAAMKCISDLLPQGSHVFVDAGNSVGWSLHYLEIDPPSRLHNALAMGPMGFAVGAVIGAKFAAPDATCLAIVGDGAFLMHGSEVSTAAANGIGAIWVVLSDNDLAMVSQGMNAFFPSKTGQWRDYYALGKPDLARFAQALGANTFEVNDADAMQRALSGAIDAARTNKVPQVIVVHIDTTQIPPYYQDPGTPPPAPAP